QVHGGVDDPLQDDRQLDVPVDRDQRVDELAEGHRLGELLHRRETFLRRGTGGVNRAGVPPDITRSKESRRDRPDSQLRPIDRLPRRRAGATMRPCATAPTSSAASHCPWCWAPSRWPPSESPPA